MATKNAFAGFAPGKSVRLVREVTADMLYAHGITAAMLNSAIKETGLSVGDRGSKGFINALFVPPAQSFMTVDFGPEGLPLLISLPPQCFDLC